MKRALLLMLGLALFGWGVAVGTYRIFPFSLIYAARQEVGKVTNGPFVNDAAVRMGQNEAFLATDADVAMVGDSITDAARWNEMFPGLIIANRGIDGDTIGGLSKRLDAIIATRAETIFLMIGINDIFGGNDVGYIVGRYEDVVARLKPDAKVILQSTLQCSRTFCSDGQRAKVEALNAALAQVAKRQGVTYVDLNARFAPGGSLSPAYTYDGVHLNSAGFALWREMLAPHMPQKAG